MNFAAAQGLKKPVLESRQPRCGEAPFDSGRKMMSTIHRTDNGFIQYTKGAPDEIIARIYAAIREKNAQKVIVEK